MDTWMAILCPFDTDIDAYPKTLVHRYNYWLTVHGHNQAKQLKMTKKYFRFYCL